MLLKNIKWPDLDEKQKYDFVVPVGSTEQHGPFLPFGTDTFMAEFLMDGLNNEFAEVIFLPVLEFSRAQEHKGFFGTIYLQEETLKQVLLDICNCLKKQARSISFLNFHGGNCHILSQFSTEYAKDFEGIVLHDIEVFNDQDDAMIEKWIEGVVEDHAGNSEISSILALHPELVIVPPKDYPKQVVENPFKGDDLKAKCPNGIADNHPEWVVSAELGVKINQLYLQRAKKSLKQILG